MKKNINLILLILTKRATKVVKDHFVVSDEIINKDDLLSLLKFINRFSRIKTNILLVGFESLSIDILKLNLDKIDLSIITTSLSNLNFDINYIEALVLHYNKNDILQIFDVDILKKWLESKSNIALELKDIENYFKNIIDNKTLIIEKAFKNL